MPIKRRADKSRNRLDEFLLEDLFYGPGTCLFNGAGYLAPHDDGMWREKSPEVQALVLAEMEADWQRFAHRIIAAWEDRSPHDRKIAREYHGDPAEPWAATHFGAVE